ncbi:ATP-binding protein [Streptomyces qinzhouensis]|uniref:ATP-binding protein n=1 Tax=Streptomyces qinzhouensis TaxID=2599401 RepID=A0A5B8JTJ3_9ACTN|nr:ATP-binding protein [Streptomyces qinzhouensis]QDY81430.1 ATP-binding protein [Streptomyces qinzhouensis]
MSGDAFRCAGEGIVSGGQKIRFRGTYGEVLAARAWCCTFPGTLEQVGRARHWTGKALGDAPFLDDAVSIVTELCANALRHTASGKGSGVFHLALTVSRWGVTLSVTDQGGAVGVPELKPLDRESENGRGVYLVSKLARRVVIRRVSGCYRVTADVI